MGSANWKRDGWPRVAALAGLSAALLACHTGTPAAPEGTIIAVGCDIISSNATTGDFDAIVNALVFDDDSDVPQVGVGVYFIVESGPGVIQTSNPVVTDAHGHAQAVLSATGARSGNAVTVNISSGPVESTLDMDVDGCSGSHASAPVAALRITPATGPYSRTSAVTIDVGTSTDADCPGSKPDDWDIDWGDGTAHASGGFNGSTSSTHTYGASAPDPVTVTVTVTDCTGLTDTLTQTLDLQ